MNKAQLAARRGSLTPVHTSRKTGHQMAGFELIMGPCRLAS